MLRCGAGAGARHHRDLARADWPRAEAEFLAALEIGRRCGTSWGQPTCLEGLAVLAFQRHDSLRAARLLGRAASVRARQRASLPEAERPRLEQLLRTLRPGEPTYNPS
jgi:hypothetical protein